MSYFSYNFKNLIIVFLSYVVLLSYDKTLIFLKFQKILCSKVTNGTYIILIVSYIKMVAPNNLSIIASVGVEVYNSPLNIT